MNDELRFGVIGCGGIATEVHCPNLAAIPGACTWAYCDLEEGKAQHLLEVHGGEYCTADAERIIEDPNIEAVLIQTGPRMHPALVQAAARPASTYLSKSPLRSSWRMRWRRCRPWSRRGCGFSTAPATGWRRW